MKMSKKGQQAFTIGQLSVVAISLVVTAVVLGIGGTILTNVQTGQGNSTIAANITGMGLSGVNIISSYVPTVALVAVAAVVIGIILFFFTQREEE